MNTDERGAETFDTARHPMREDRRIIYTESNHSGR